MPMATPITAEEPPGGPRCPASAGPVPAQARPVLADGGLADGGPASARILREGARDGCVTHIQRIPGRPGRVALWPDWVPSELRERFGRAGITAPWEHQVAAAEHARAGRNVILSTPAASGKSLGYLMPALTAVLDGGP